MKTTPPQKLENGVKGNLLYEKYSPKTPKAMIKTNPPKIKMFGFTERILSIRFCLFIASLLS